MAAPVLPRPGKLSLATSFERSNQCLGQFGVSLAEVLPPVQVLSGGHPPGAQEIGAVGACYSVASKAWAVPRDHVAWGGAANKLYRVQG